ncbi:hypothetical protein PIB30_110252, partial [Stylosanthes scabra]|nr:hypothetical protein [Stylosanthes scabra]
SLWRSPDLITVTCGDRSDLIKVACGDHPILSRELVAIFPILSRKLVAIETRTYHSPSHLSLVWRLYPSYIKKYTKNRIFCYVRPAILITMYGISMSIDDYSVKKLRRKEIPLVKVAWNHGGVMEHTWEKESDMREHHP